MYRYDAANYDPTAWDDTDLIRAYDAALNSFEKKCKVNGDNNSAGSTGGTIHNNGGGAKLKSANSRKSYPGTARSNSSRKSSSTPDGEKVLVWNVGDRCSAYFTEDGELYPAEIISIKGSSCYVRYFIKQQFGFYLLETEKRQVPKFDCELALKSIATGLSLFKKFRVKNLHSFCFNSVERASDL